MHGKSHSIKNSLNLKIIKLSSKQDNKQWKIFNNIIKLLLILLAISTTSLFKAKGIIKFKPELLMEERKLLIKLWHGGDLKSQQINTNYKKLSWIIMTICLKDRILKLVLVVNYTKVLMISECSKKFMIVIWLSVFHWSLKYKKLVKNYSNSS